ncbi:non-ribosomal peptide synthetase [Aminipila sp.]|uniref:non-ribosomal peptide synthetase n=1 Tax=Aminipila sp. TaxID=2060095 RepID=UPI002898B055|nr:non-ribosomal peptide synthetase [Aminipila sp.]
MFKRSDVKDMYPLSPMQQGMLFHNMMDEKSKAYFEQTTFTINGDLDLSLFEKSFNQLIKRYDALRTIILYEKIKEPVQVVLKERSAKIYYTDISDMEEQQKEIWFERFKKKDMEKGFNLSEDMLIRISVIKIEQEKYGVVWSSHHIMMDGWCLGIIIKDFFTIYHNLKYDKNIILPPVYSYSNYINWLLNQNKEEGITYWKKYLESYKAPTGIPTFKAIREGALYERAEMSFSFDEELTKKIEYYARKLQVTVSTVLQAAWAVLLQRYNDTDDVVFGNVVAGRPSEISGIESMVGLFINTVPIRVKWENGESFDDMVIKIQKSSLESKMYEYLSLTEIQATTELKNNLFNNIMIFENYPMEESVENICAYLQMGFNVSNIKVFEQTNYNFNIAIIPGKEMTVKLNYNAKMYDKFFLGKMESHFIMVIEQVMSNPQIEVQQIDIISEKEKRQIIDEFNNTEAEYPKDKTLQKLFEEQVKKTPDNIALIHNDVKMTYRELNRKSNQLANYLRSKGIGREHIVGILMDRGISLIVTILAVLKAGGAYLPIDLAYPKSRIEYMLKDSKLTLLLVGDNVYKDVDYKGTVINTNDKDLFGGDDKNLEGINTSSDLAYVIYTSGSTGKPKCAMLEHKSVINYVWWAAKNYVKGKKLDFPLYTSISFDLTVTSLYVPLITGNSIVIYGKDNRELLIEKVFKENKVGVVKLTPAHLKVIKDRDNSQLGVKLLIVGGDQLDTETAKAVYESFGGKVEIYNEYGPTETSVGCMIYRYNHNNDNGLVVPIGVPADNVQIYLLDKHLHLVPTNTVGEIYISGDGLARGYLGTTEFTNEQFISNPFIPGKKMYKTGDMAKRLKNGNIEYIGRNDEQVKIRGYRIEIGEIEKRLMEHGEISQAFVLSKNYKDGSKYLCGYYVSQKAIQVKELRSFILKELPQYMIPSYFTHLKKMPLTPNGKVDKKSLPEPEVKLNTCESYIAPRDNVEERLAEIWAEVLGTNQVGINDSFFDMGGDSIKAIQVVARLQKFKLRLQVKDLFDNPTIGEVSQFVRTEEVISEQGMVTGDAELTPVQTWFFSKEIVNRNYFNYSVMLYSKEGFRQKVLRKALDKVLIHHDILRSIFLQEEGVIKQYIQKFDENSYILEVFDLTKECNYAEMIKQKALQIQSSMNLEKGPLVRVGLFKTGEADYLLLAIHHLLVDGVSWRILLEDIQTGYSQASMEKEIELPQKTGSYKEWAKKLLNYSQGKEIIKEMGYWQHVRSMPIEVLYEGNIKKSGKMKDSKTIKLELNKWDTDKLLKDANNTYNTEINDLLLTALSRAVTKWKNKRCIAITLEGHGREEILGDINITRTVGWFTTMYPIILRNEDEDIGNHLKKIKEILRSVPNKGIGYGVIRYLRKDTDVVLDTKPEISFNYLGQFDSDTNRENFQLSTLDKGSDICLENEIQHSIEINGSVIGGQLNFWISYDSLKYKEAEVQILANEYKQAIQEILKHCIGKEETEATPSDMTGKGLTTEDLEDVFGNLENIFGE